MKVSIVIPCWNQAEYLPEAIGSALGQTYKDIEVIVVNDGSPDATAEIATKYPVKLVNQVNKGLASARNTGVMNAIGDYILFLDADDILLENCVERMMQETADVIAPSFRCFGVSDRECVLTNIPTLEDFKTANRIGYFSAIRRSVLLEVGGYNPKMLYGFEDYDLWFDIFKRGHSLAVTPEILVLYRTKTNSMIHEANKHSDFLLGQIRKNHPTVFS